MIVSIQHRTTYRYAVPVELGTHRVMLEPRCSPDIEVLSCDLHVSPASTMHAGKDAFGNPVRDLQFAEPSEQLEILCKLEVEHQPRTLEEIEAQIAVALDAGVDDLVSLAWAAKPQSTIGNDRLLKWTQAATKGAQSALDAMVKLTAVISESCRYQRRESFGTQDPIMTLNRQSGTCRDFAFLMVEAARQLGYPALFASGYLYDEATDALQGGGATHAWAKIRLPGSWVEFDPTNNLVGGQCLIQVAATLEPNQASPIVGSYYGTASDFLGMAVDVQTFARTPEANLAPGFA